ncbi:hypothetical protein Bca101_027487 [Brassica carinata]
MGFCILLKRRNTPTVTQHNLTTRRQCHHWIREEVAVPSQAGLLLLEFSYSNSNQGESWLSSKIHSMILLISDVQNMDTRPCATLLIGWEKSNTNRVSKHALGSSGLTLYLLLRRGFTLR